MSLTYPKYLIEKILRNVKIDSTSYYQFANA